MLVGSVLGKGTDWTCHGEDSALARKGEMYRIQFALEAVASKCYKNLNSPSFLLWRKWVRPC